MSLNIQINFKELKKITRWTASLEEKLTLADERDKQLLADRLKAVMSEDLALRFGSSPATTQGGQVYGDVFWKPLSESYLKNRPERVQGRIYIDTGELMRSFDVNSSHIVSEFDKDLKYNFGTRIPYAEKLNEMRPIVVLHQELLDKLAKEFLDWLLEKEGF